MRDAATGRWCMRDAATGRWLMREDGIMAGPMKIADDYAAKHGLPALEGDERAAFRRKIRASWVRNRVEANKARAAGYFHGLTRRGIAIDPRGALFMGPRAAGLFRMIRL